LSDPRPRPTISVVVASYNTPKTLEMCLRSLASQSAEQVLVLDCSDQDPAPLLSKQFPAVRFFYFGEAVSIPRLRWKGFRESTGDVVANLESWMVPGPGWVEALREVHSEQASAPVVGGAVAFDPGDGGSAFQWGDFFYEYGRHMAPADGGGADDGVATGGEASSRETEDGEVAELTGANCSYKRAALEECDDLLEHGAWDSALHERFQKQGTPLWRAGSATVEYCGDPTPRQVILQRFHYGRWFAAERNAELTFAERVVRCLTSPLVPWILLRRLWQSLDGKPGARRQLARSVAWVMFSYSLWSLGEARGYLLGGGSSEHRIF